MRLTGLDFEQQEFGVREKSWSFFASFYQMNERPMEEESRIKFHCIEPLRIRLPHSKCMRRHLGICIPSKVNALICYRHNPYFVGCIHACQVRIHSMYVQGIVQLRRPEIATCTRACARTNCQICLPYAK